MIVGIGTDIVSKERILNSNVEDRFLNEDEKVILNKIDDRNARLDFIAGRWAAKESIIKASRKSISFSEISILKNDDGSPMIKINGEISIDIQLSISHEDKYAVAFSIITKKV